MGKKVVAKINKRALQAFVDKVNGVRTAFGAREAADTAKEVIAEMKDLISKGISPVRSAGRFPGYLHSGKKGKYPDSVKHKYPAKRDRPVNLWLSGDFINSLGYRIYEAKFGFGFEVGYFDPEEAKKEEGHAIGQNGQPKRPTIPSTQEEFAVRIQRLIYRRFKEAISRFVKSK